MLVNKRNEKRRKKQLQQLESIADSFLKARGVYPPDYDGFLEIARQKQVDLFYQTMFLIEQSAKKIDYVFDWSYDKKTEEWRFLFLDIGAADKKLLAASYL